MAWQTYIAGLHMDLTTFKSEDGIEILINTETGESFCSVSGYARMSGKAKSSIHDRLKTVQKEEENSAKIPTSKGMREVSLIPLDLVLSFLAIDKPGLVKILIDIVEFVTQKRPELPSFAQKEKARYKRPEKEVQKRLAQSLQGEIEVQCKSGNIDILTDTQVIEVKKCKDWKHAIGQVLVYQLEYPDKQARIHLYETCSSEFQLMVNSFASKLNILVTFESDLSYQGRKASALCRQKGISPQKVNDPRFGVVGTYPDSILEELVW
ncbi:MAG: hypothetical protein F6J86_41415 [Symploca sp. SIO1B1]|nr:hypothetical protein [Symploca sp. SIO1B1]